MENSFSDFQRKRMIIFGELVKRYWNGRLNDVEDLNELTDEIKEQYGFRDEDRAFIMDHIRIAMGLDPTGEDVFRNELELVKNFNVVNKPVIARIDGPCEYCDENSRTCRDTCLFESHVYRRSQGPVIVNDKCVTCGRCVTACDFGALADKIEFIPVIELLKEKKNPVFVVVAPAIAGQFGDDVTLGQLRSAFKLMGFTDMIEVAMFADILTIKEAFEFNHLVKTTEDFFLTSCCCPVWFNMTKKNYSELYKHMSPSVSPMIASGRILKKLYPDCRVVFIAPCIAKKAEIKEEELKGAIDFVINFRELKEIFNALQINPAELPGEEKDQGSLGGRLYARTGGVSFSVKTVVNRINPSRLIKLKAKKVDGAANCKKILDELSGGGVRDYNFIEGMGCVGGCVGGPRTIIDVDKATQIVNEVAEDSIIMTPFDNLNVMKILRQLGINKIEEIMENPEVVKLLTRE
ncbi:hydrogenase large subunit domain protein [Thermoclostridium stercorarium subsp. stercorarium DSM 8532]|uniref:Hydrogenase large subunit domain protein n=3 Tax=Thermoclostridium stercorarium TaxID=1510 RepID=L7VVM5_THES1|nr:[Fe-Fe] hydrogenase large subunit C-terminal domain-containing protein [Thermoclostridium stercorarium]AGC69608.1 hydrogenase large subunit domain protein [Thermoclostridium stercorarium subsp. stercorarium DSM 8532]AGI40559.1 Ffh [Thermoclostridium stercorarium subsp. stercorarium DSM 8532]ANW99836.1 iron hydrogenase [Thermoclostridium stercorarium subsp. thermolacticum DSM 2910]ANX02462.1 iron hydrogenase [Thermoclostridium stercorarium subsp. leptospartum DSM 9219]UZQ85546.1 4Fe-4S bindi